MTSEYGNPDTFTWNEKTLECVTQVDGPVAKERECFQDKASAASFVKQAALESGAAMVG